MYVILFQLRVKINKIKIKMKWPSHDTGKKEAKHKDM